ncbi:MFS transporter [Streptomyces marincola]|uniref:MFS transporter n=1 Tax=Streptomyces marincola TaxID=2878388 RepID=A0A1W7CWG0_9ACTN|nr:MFS transporter [Streptomyces marincola]ARQ69112.1 MFS transporter [Streptomyces marincola]
MPVPLLALTVCSFAIGTTEFVVNGLLPEVAGDFGVSIPTAGLLVSGYALGVAVGGPLLTAFTTRVTRKDVLTGLMVLFIAGSVLSALAPSYGLLMTGRVLSACCHGVFFGIGSVVAADLVRPDRRAGAIALVFTGLSLANVLGVPMGTVLGQHFGWRSAFWAVTALGVIGLAGIVVLLPRRPPPPNGGLARELAAFRRPSVWAALGITAIGFGGLMSSFTYLAPMMTGVTGYGPGSIAWLLVLFGVGVVAGNLVGGKAADQALEPTILILLAALAATLAVFTLTAHHKLLAALTVAVLGCVGYATIPPLQTYILRQVEGAGTLASAANIGAFNLGAALGAYLGGAAIDAGLGPTAPNWTGALLSATGLVLALAAFRHERRAAERFARVPASATPAGRGRRRGEVRGR